MTADVVRHDDGGGAPAHAGALPAKVVDAMAGGGPLPLRPPGDERQLVSVLIPNKDYGRFLPEALDALLAQTYEPWEAIVCDDGSSDDSREVVGRYAERDPRISLVVHERSRGQAAAFNSAFEVARGDVIAFLDSDDVPAERRLEEIVATFRRTNAGLVVHALTLTGPDGRPIQRIPAFTAFERGWIADRVLRRGGRWRWAPTSGVALRREVATVVFPMPEKGYQSSADTYFLVLAPTITTVAAIEEPLGLYRRHGSNAFARSGLDIDQIPRTMENLAVSVDRVNERLAELGRAGRLRVEDNLRYQELAFQRDLFADPGRSALWRRYRVLVTALIRDDLYGTVQKLWAPVLYGASILLPHRSRRSWLAASLSASRPKELARRSLVRSRERA